MAIDARMSRTRGAVRTWASVTVRVADCTVGAEGNIQIAIAIAKCRPTPAGSIRVWCGAASHALRTHQDWVPQRTDSQVRNAHIGRMTHDMATGPLTITPGASAPRVAAVAAQYVCPMHAQIVRSAPGLCPICGMALVS